MQIVCPNCTTPYQVAPSAIGEGGRSVRCVRCRTVWFAPPPPIPMPERADSPANGADEVVEASRSEPAPEPPETASPPTETDNPADAPPAALADIPIAPIAVDDAPPLVPAEGSGLPAPTVEMDSGPPDIESVAARRARAAARRRRERLRIRLPLAIVALIALCVALLGWRRDIVRYAPQLASFYNAIGLPVNLRGIEFADVKIGNEIHDGVPVLVIEGLIVSTVSMPVDVPRLRFALRSATGAEVYSWTAQPSQPVLGPFETLPFRSRLASPPADGHDIQVRFFTRRDAVAGVR
jgi:predicted Zn finger-like uncharacterized protein